MLSYIPKLIMEVYSSCSDQLMDNVHVIHNKLLKLL